MAVAKRHIAKEYDTAFGEDVAVPGKTSLSPLMTEPVMSRADHRAGSDLAVVERFEPPRVETARPQSAVSVRQLNEDQQEIVMRVWGPSVLGDPLKCSAIASTQEVLVEESVRMLRSAIVVGRSLNRLREVLSSDEFERGLRESRVAFRGWSTGNLSKLMNVARFVDDRRLVVDAVPQSYSVLYEFTTLDEKEFDRARSIGIFRPDVRRVDVQEFKKHIRLGEMPGATERPANLVRIEERIRALQTELRELRLQRTKALAVAKSAKRVGQI
jgi:hypothetical protein